MDAPDQAVTVRLADGTELYLKETLQRRGLGSALMGPYTIVSYAGTFSGRPWRWAIQIGTRASESHTDDDLRDLARAKLQEWMSEAELRPGGRMWHRRLQEFV